MGGIGGMDGGNREEGMEGIGRKGWRGLRDVGSNTKT